MTSELERARLVKLLGMLGSNFDGERANAALMIARMAAQANLTIPELCVAAPEGAPRHKQREEKEKVRVRHILELLEDIAQQWSAYVTAWELEFAQDVSQKYLEDDDLSEKQRKVAERIIHKVSVAQLIHKVSVAQQRQDSGFGF